MVPLIRRTLLLNEHITLSSFYRISRKRQFLELISNNSHRTIYCLIQTYKKQRFFFVYFWHQILETKLVFKILLNVCIVSLMVRHIVQVFLVVQVCSIFYNFFSLQCSYTVFFIRLHVLIEKNIKFPRTVVYI